MAAKDNLSGQLRLFTPEGTSPDPIDVSRWARNQQWHASNDELLPSRDRGDSIPASLDEFDRNGDEYNGAGGHPLGIHSGTAWSARERDTPDGQRVYHPLAIHGEDASPSPDAEAWSSGGSHVDRHGKVSEVWSDDLANGGSVETTKAVRAGKNVAYRNEGEDVGSISYRSPRSNVRTWSDSVVHNPNATHAERDAVRRGAELVYLPGKPIRSVEGWTITSEDGSSASSGAKKKTSKPVKSPAGLTATPIKIAPNPDGFQEDKDLSSTLTPKFVYPHKKKKGQGKTQGEQLTLDF